VAGNPSKPRDVVLIGGPTEDGEGVNVLRAHEERLELGTLQPLKEGKSIRGEVVRLKPRREQPRVFDVETELEVPGPGAAREAKPQGQGPAQVASETYRRNWDAIWNRPARRRLPN
jgi:hypothetical protein